MLKIDKVTKTFHAHTILDAVSLTVQRGEIAVLLGSSGVGKSTLLRILNNLETIDTGSIYLDNALLDLKTVNKTHTVGMVFQNFNLFEHITVERNITLPLEVTAGFSPEQARIRADELLQLYGLAHKKSLFISQLSGGQKQRLALARTLALRPTVICLDEPTSALDPLLTTHVAHSIENLAKEGYIVLVATHDTTLLERLVCTMYLMERGTIIEQASSQTFYQNPLSYPLLQKFITGSV
jgi:polar amino acid transport system ATP-binding protein